LSYGARCLGAFELRLPPGVPDLTRFGAESRALSLTCWRPLKTP
jgi:hypothetical protein